MSTLLLGRVRALGSSLLSRVNRSTVQSLALGQLLSLLVTGTGVTSSLLAARGVNMPSTQSLINYALLALYAVALGKREGAAGVRDVLRRKWWMYALLALCDVEANYLVVLAYQYTSLSSIMLLDCFSIPCVMLLGFWVLKHRFRWTHFAGVAACVAGVVALVLSDWLHGAWSGTHNTSNVLLGDGLVVGASVLYAVSNTGQELQVVQLGSKLEYLAMLGVFGLPISAVQSAVLDHAAWASAVWTPQTIGLMIGFAVCLFCMYSLVPLMLEWSGATLLNLSLLTSDVLAIVIGIFLFDYVPSLWYLLSSALIVAGLVFYNIGNAPTRPMDPLGASAAPMDAGDSGDEEEAAHNGQLLGN